MPTPMGRHVAEMLTLELRDFDKLIRLHPMLPLMPDRRLRRRAIADAAITWRTPPKMPLTLSADVFEAPRRAMPAILQRCCAYYAALILLLSAEARRAIRRRDAASAELIEAQILCQRAL